VPMRSMESRTILIWQAGSDPTPPPPSVPSPPLPPQLLVLGIEGCVEEGKDGGWEVDGIVDGVLNRSAFVGVVDGFFLSENLGFDVVVGASSLSLSESLRSCYWAEEQALVIVSLRVADNFLEGSNKPDCTASDHRPAGRGSPSSDRC
jgi:hypothetical protein